MTQNRVSKGTTKGGQFAPDESGKVNVPTPRSQRVNSNSPVSQEETKIESFYVSLNKKIKLNMSRNAYLPDSALSKDEIKNIPRQV